MSVILGLPNLPMHGVQLLIRYRSGLGDGASLVGPWQAFFLMGYPTCNSGTNFGSFLWPFTPALIAAANMTTVTNTAMATVAAPTDVTRTAAIAAAASPAARLLAVGATSNICCCRCSLHQAWVKVSGVLPAVAMVC